MHDWRLICFSLYVDDFGIKYVVKQHAEHLMVVLQDQYKILSDWKGKRYLGLNIDWEYENRILHLLILGFLAESLTIFLHKHPRKPHY